MKFNAKKHLPILLLLGIVTLLGVLLVMYEQRNNPKLGSTQNNSSDQEQPTIIRLERNGFNPSNISVSKGSRIIWINNTANTATVNSDNHPTHTLFPFLNLGSFEQGSTVQVVLDKEGTFKYHNHFIPTQQGTIVVK